MRKSTLPKVVAAATIFAQRGGCSAQEIADILKVPLNSVYHFAKQPEWAETLDTLRYTGDREFTKKTTRDALKDSGELVAQARGIYLMERNTGVDHTNAVSSVCRNLPELKRRRVNEWAKKYNWEDVL